MGSLAAAGSGWRSVHFRSLQPRYWFVSYQLLCGRNPATKPPRFEDYPIREAFKGTPSAPSLVTPEERRYRTVIRRGVEMGYGVAEPPIGKERRGPNFAGHYFIVRWGCGSPCLMAAIVDAKSGHILPPPFHLGPRNSCFQVPWNFPMEPLDYRLNSRLLIAIFAKRIAKQKLTIGPFINPTLWHPLFPHGR